MIGQPFYIPVPVPAELSDGRTGFVATVLFLPPSPQIEYRPSDEKLCIEVAPRTPIHGVVSSVMFSLTWDEVESLHDALNKMRDHHRRDLRRRARKANAGQ